MKVRRGTFSIYRYYFNAHFRRVRIICVRYIIYIYIFIYFIINGQKTIEVHLYTRHKYITEENKVTIILMEIRKNAKIKPKIHIYMYRNYYIHNIYSGFYRY